MSRTDWGEVVAFVTVQTWDEKKGLSLKQWQERIEPQIIKIEKGEILTDSRGRGSFQK